MSDAALTPWPEHINSVEEARDCIIRALYAGFNGAVSGEALNSEALNSEAAREKMMEIVLHYSDALADQKALIKQAYGMVLYAPHVWPASHAWSVASRTLGAIGLKTDTLKDAWRITVLLGMGHRIAQAWFDASVEDDFLQALDDITTHVWPCMENGLQFFMKPPCP